MMKNTRFLLMPIGVALTGMMALPAMAQEASGTVDVSMELATACSIDGATGSGLDLGALDFASETTLFDNAETGVLAGGGIEILCSPGTTPTIAITGGGNDGSGTGGGTHAMTNAGGGFISYSLYTDAGRTELLANTTPTALEGTPDGITAQTFNLYGTAFGEPGLAAGTYSDTLNVVLTF